MNNNYGKLSSTEFNNWLDKVSEYETENCVESISESSEDDTSHCFLKSEKTTQNNCMVKPLSECEENKYKHINQLSSSSLQSKNKVEYVQLSSSECCSKIYKPETVIKQCSCLKTNSVPLDSEYFNSIIPPISLLYKDKNKVQMIQNKNIKNIQSVNIKKLRVRRRNK